MLGNRLIRGEKVYLGPLRVDDAPRFAEWFADLEFLALLGTNPLRQMTLQTEQQWLEAQVKNENSYQFGIYTCSDNEIIGSAGLHAPHWRNRSAELGIAVGNKAFWGKGYGTEASRLVLNYGFWELNLHRISLLVYAYNHRAIRSYEKLGFVHEVVRREAVYRDGHYYDILVMSLLRHEWGLPHAGK
jgi:RimJ/RimL family protein N-acetyltransferase